jgi:protein arginine N-methyltransferase 1
MYTLRNFGEMIADHERFSAYTKAIKQAVRPGDSVLEIGCGPGIFALLACQAGAGRVYAVDSEEIVHFARELAVANGFADRIVFIQSDSRKVQLPERVSVIISDIRGALPFFGHGVETIENARNRLLLPGGQVVPQRDTLKATVVEALDFYSRLVSPWQEPAAALNFSRSIEVLLNETYKVHFNDAQVLTTPQTWAVLDYAGGAQSNAAADLDFVVARPGTAHGICLWFETELLNNVGFSSRPQSQKTVYGQVFLPWLEPVPVHLGQKIAVSLRADLIAGDYVWRWDTKICGNGTIALDFRQSTFQSANFTSESLRRRAAGFVPSLSEHGKAERWLLHAMDGNTSLQQMAQSAAQRFPTIFPHWQDALHRAAELAIQFSR